MTKHLPKDVDLPLHRHSRLRRYRRLKTIGLFAGYINYGIAISILGPTIVSLEELLDTDMKSISFAYTSFRVGLLLGSFTASFIYGKCNKELLSIASLLMVGLSLSVAPFTGHLYGFYMAMGVNGIAIAVFHIAGTTSALALWKGHKYRESLLQAMYVCFATGGILGPLLIQPFLPRLVERTMVLSNASESSVCPNISVVSDVFPRGNVSEKLDSCNSSADATTQEPDVKNVRYAFVTLGSYSILPCVIFLGVFLAQYFKHVDERSCAKPAEGLDPPIQDASHVTTESDRRRPWPWRLLIALMFCFYLTYIGIEVICAGYLASFVVKGLGWTSDHGALVTSIYFGGMALGLVFGVFLSTLLTPVKIGLINYSLILAGLLLMFFAHYHQIVMWVAAGLLGLGCSTCYGCGFLIAAKLIEITAGVTSVFFTGTAIGGIVAPPITGTLLQNWGEMAVVYVLVVTYGLHVSVFALIVIFARKAFGEPKSIYINVPVMSE